MDKLFGGLILFIIYMIPLIGVVYSLAKLFKKQLAQTEAVKSKESYSLLIYVRLSLIAFGILYGLFILTGMIIAFFQPAWFYPPLWLKLLFIILVVPYLACVWGFMGLGYAGHGGVSPSTIVKNGMSIMLEKKEISKNKENA